MSSKSNKNEAARFLAEAHVRNVPSISRVIRLLGTQEQAANEPIKLLEINSETAPSGIVPISFGANPPQIPYPSVVVEVTESEFDDIKAGTMRLPDGWSLGETLFEGSAVR